MDVGREEKVDCDLPRRVGEWEPPRWASTLEVALAQHQRSARISSSLTASAFLPNPVAQLVCLYWATGDSVSQPWQAMSNGRNGQVRGMHQWLSPPAVHDTRNTDLKIDILNSIAVGASPAQQIYRTANVILALTRVSVSFSPTCGLSLVAHLG